MEQLDSGTDSNGQLICQLCNISPRRYICPKCEVPYCSMQCYKSASHSECSETFYRECVEGELKIQEQDPETRSRMIDILKRMYTEDMEFEDNFHEESIDDEDAASCKDSDDEDDVPELEERLRGINLENADELWSALTNAERQEFEATLRNGHTADFVPPWLPWWSNSRNRKMIEEVVDDKAEPEYVAKCPKIVHVPAFNDLTKASPFVRFNLLNVLHAYAYMALHCNGDHKSSATESVKIFLHLCDNMLSNKIFEDSTSAIEAVTLKCSDCPSSNEEKEARVAVEQAVNLIINGPEKSNPTFYVSAALSDLHGLFADAKREFSHKNENSNDRTFSAKFRKSDNVPTLTKKMLLLSTKKIEYYLSWIKKYGMTVD